MSRNDELVKAAGTIPFRIRGDALEVLLVHRPRYDDWSWPKGKLDPHEDWAVAAVRETFEETGLVVRLGVPLPTAYYEVAGKTQPNPKEVRYWAAAVTQDTARLEHEIDAVEWVSPREAHRRLTYQHDREPLRAVERLHKHDMLRTWPLLVVRHAKALSRKEWDREDYLRPLNKRGEREAAALVQLLSAYQPLRIVTSSSTRCVDTVAPFAQQQGVRCELADELSEEGWALEPSHASSTMGVLAHSYHALALCSHGPVLPALLEQLLQCTRPTSQALHEVKELVHDNLHKGEVMVAHASYHAIPHLVAVERHLPDFQVEGGE